MKFRSLHPRHLAIPAAVVAGLGIITAAVVPTLSEEPAPVVAAPVAPVVVAAPVPVVVPPFSTVTNLGPGTLPLRSQHPFAVSKGKALVALFDAGKVYVVEVANGVRHEVTSVTGNPNPTLSAGPDGRVVIYWQSGRLIKSSTSTDLVTWTKAVTVATAGAGGPIPCACYTGTDHVLVWVTVPKESDTGGMDGYGPLYAARTPDGKTWVTTQVAARSALAVCAEGANLVVSKDEARDRGTVGVNAMMTYALDGSSPKLIGYGFDAAIATDGTTFAVGYHEGVSAHLFISRDSGATWADTQLDQYGKFVQVGVTEGKVAAVWVDFLTSADAQNPRGDEMTHYATAWYDGTLYPLNGGKAGTTQGNLAIINGVPAVAYKADGNIYVAM